MGKNSSIPPHYFSHHFRHFTSQNAELSCRKTHLQALHTVLYYSKYLCFYMSFSTITQMALGIPETVPKCQGVKSVFQKGYLTVRFWGMITQSPRAPFGTVSFLVGQVHNRPGGFLEFCQKSLRHDVYL